ncbi:MAG TPA: L-ribulose-5-phosphate 4-epimerase AraD [Gemmatimonadales bacterium]|nr:L-ribulose-5-phosphate 4-epimerase AraD [Gemmatimonadales bacterium]
MIRVAAALRKSVLRANQALVESGLVTETFGNVSGVDRAAGLFVIKPSGVPYEELTPAHMVPVSLETGRVLGAGRGRGSDLRPSSDTATHLELYRAFSCGGIAHSHSPYATAFAQARRALPCLGTTHADYFRGDVPVTRPLSREEVEREYERHTGLVIVETFRAGGLSAEAIPGVLVAHHGPFTWGADARAAVERARVLEYLAFVACMTRVIDGEARGPAAHLVDKHFRRKHGKDAYYGQ